MKDLKNLIKKLKNLKKNNKTIAGYAATSKSTTVFNYCNINRKLIDFICDTTKEKIESFPWNTYTYSFYETFL